MTAPTLPVIVELPSDSLTTRTPGAALARVETIAAIHATAEYFAEHPELPVPTEIHLWRHDYERPQALMDGVAVQNGGEASHGKGVARIQLPIRTPAQLGPNDVVLYLAGYGRGAV